jgi:high-affinity nickel-transport protein
MRHGIDPDHLAIINGINLNNHANGRSSIWSGLFFSLGLGITVTLIGVFLIEFKNGAQSFATIVRFTEWIPILLLLFTGLYGCYTLFGKKEKKEHEHQYQKIISVFTNSKSLSLKLFLTGLFFALIFDTSTQVAAWAIIGDDNSQHSYFVAIFIGISFTAGMMISDTLNGLFFYQILKEKNSRFNLKLLLSLLLILSSLLIGSIQLLEKLGYSIEISDQQKLIWGLCMMTAIVLAAFVNVYCSKKQSVNV